MNGRYLAEVPIAKTQEITSHNLESATLMGHVKYEHDTSPTHRILSCVWLAIAWV